MFDRLFAALAIPFGAHWKVTASQAHDMAEVLLNSESVPITVVDRFAKASGPISVIATFLLIIYPRVQVTINERAAARTPQAEAYRRGEQTARTAHSFGYDVQPPPPPPQQAAPVGGMPQNGAAAPPVVVLDPSGGWSAA